MPGAVMIVIFLVVVFPVAFLIGMSVLAGVLGWVIKDEVDSDFEGTEDLAVSRM